MKKLIQDFIESLKQSVKDRKYKEVFIYVIGLTFLAATSIFLLRYLFIVLEEIFFFVKDNGRYVLALITIFIFCYFVVRWKIDERRKLLEEKHRQEEIAATEVKKDLAESNYETVKNILYRILSEEIFRSHGIAALTNLSSLESPKHYIMRQNTLIFFFTVAKAGEVNPSTISELLSNRIRQLCASHSIGLEPTSFVHSSGRAFDILLVDEVSDFGNFLQIAVTFASEEYCSMRIMRQAQKFDFPFGMGSNKHDDDF